MGELHVEKHIPNRKPGRAKGAAQLPEREGMIFVNFGTIVTKGIIGDQNLMLYYLAPHRDHADERVAGEVQVEGSGGH